MSSLGAISGKLDLLLAKNGDGPKYLGVEAAAGYLSISVESVRRLIAAGRLKSFKPTPGRLVVRRQDLDKLVLNSEV